MKWVQVGSRTKHGICFIPVDAVNEVNVVMDFGSVMQFEILYGVENASVFLGKDATQAAIEALGLAAALSLPATEPPVDPASPQPSSVDDDARRYQTLKHLLGIRKEILLTQKFAGIDVEVLCGCEELACGRSLDEALDRRRV